MNRKRISKEKQPTELSSEDELCDAFYDTVFLMMKATQVSMNWHTIMKQNLNWTILPSKKSGFQHFLPQRKQRNII
jgi:hypothetical protein